MTSQIRSITLAHSIFLHATSLLVSTWRKNSAYIKITGMDCAGTVLVLVCQTHLVLHATPLLVCSGTMKVRLYQTHTLLPASQMLAWTGRDKECLSHRRSTGSTTVAQLWCVPNSHLASYDPTVSVNMKRQAVFKSPKVNWVDCNGTAWCFCTKLAIIFHTTPSTSRQKEDI